MSEKKAKKKDLPFSQKLWTLDKEQIDWMISEVLKERPDIEAVNFLDEQPDLLPDKTQLPSKRQLAYIEQQLKALKPHPSKQITNRLVFEILKQELSITSASAIMEFAEQNKIEGVTKSIAGLVRSILYREYRKEALDDKQGRDKDRVRRAQELLSPSSVFSKDATETIDKITRLLELGAEFVTQGVRQPLYVYDEETGIWVERGEAVIQAKAASLLAEDHKYRSHIVDDVLKSIRQQNIMSDLQFNRRPDIMVVENGRVNIETGEFFEEFDEYEYDTIKLPVKYDPEAKCPEIERFLTEVLQPQDIDAMLEFFGYCVIKDWPYDILVMLIGSGGNGKTSLLELLIIFLGKENTIAIGLHTLEKDRFAKADLRNKLANVAGEIPNWALKSVDRIKDITGGGMISSDVKFLGRVTFRNTCKQIFSSNNPPPIDDDSPAMWRRLRTFKFLNKFNASDPKTIPRDVLLARLTTPDELSGLLNLAIAGYQRLRKQGYLSETPDEEVTRIDYMRDSNPLRYLIDVFFSNDIDAPYIEKKGLYELYRRWCAHEKKTRQMVSANRFYKDVQFYCSYLNDSHIRVENDRRVSVYTNARIDLEALKAAGINLQGISLFIDTTEQERLTDLENPSTNNDINNNSIGRGGRGSRGSMQQGIERKENGCKLPLPPRPPQPSNPEEKFILSMKDFNEWGAEALRKGEIKQVGVGEYVRVKKEVSE